MDGPGSLRDTLGPLRASARALVGPPEPLWAPWALVGQALVGPALVGAWALMGPDPNGLKYIRGGLHQITQNYKSEYIYIYIYNYIYIYISA